MSHLVVAEFLGLHHHALQELRTSPRRVDDDTKQFHLQAQAKQMR